MAIAMQLAWLGPSARSQTSHFPVERKRPWSEDSEKMLQLMTGQFEQRTETLDLLGGSTTTPLTALELEFEKPLPCGWEKCLDLKTGAVYYVNSSSGMKTTHDPAEPLSFYSVMPSAAEGLKSSEVLSGPRDDRVKKEAAAYSPMRSMMETHKTHNMLTQFVGKIKCEALCLEADASVSHEARLVDGLQRKEKYGDGNSPIEDDVGDGGLELKLKLGTNLGSAKEDKSASAVKFSAQYARDWLDKKITSSPSSYSQSDICRARACTAVEAASTSSSHSFLSLQTRDDSAVQSEGGAALGIGEAESKKTDQVMEIVGCPRCLMYVMLCKMDPRCPKCGSSVLLDFPASTSFSSSSKKPRVA